jgi:hypothetical protein
MRSVLLATLGLCACQTPPVATIPDAAVVVVRDAGVVSDALPKKTGAEMMSSALLQICVVVWVDQTPQGKTVLWLLLIPEEAVFVVLAQRAGDVTVTVRNPDDLDVLEEKKANLGTLEDGTPVPSTSRGHVRTITVPAK